MKIKVKALHTLSGDYGMAKAGDHIEIDEVHAKGLHEKGAIEFLHKEDSSKADKVAPQKEDLLVNDRQDKSKSDEKEKKDLGHNPGAKNKKK